MAEFLKLRTGEWVKELRQGLGFKKTLEPISKSRYYHKPIECHSGLSGIYLCFQNDSRRASLAGMTALKRDAILR